MYFAQPLWLLLLAVVPALAWPAVRRRRGGGVLFSSTEAAAGLPPTLAYRLRGLPLYLRLAAFALAVGALARPQEQQASRRQYAEGVDVMLVLDASTSMRARDFTPDRFEAARRVLHAFIQGRDSDRLGLVVFAAKAFTYAPLTLDYDFLGAMLADVQIGDIEDGTAIGTALATAVNRLKTSEAKSKVVVLLTDGQSNRGEIDPLTAARIAQALGVRVYAIGVGTHGRAPFVIDHPFSGRQMQLVPVEIDEKTLRAVARATGGRYYRAANEQALTAIYAEIGQMEQTRLESFVRTETRELYPLFLWPAFGLLLLEILLGATWLRRLP